MPLIAGNKYSCEPCIRGHRATHCAHTDRLLIEVRKPGRPLDRCCHKLNSCTCGRLATASSLPLSSPSPLSPKTFVVEKLAQEQMGGEVRISKEQPFGRELRLSVSSGGGEGKEGKAERRRGKVFKRHRLSREKSGRSVREVEGDTEMEDEEEVEEPELSPSLSSSESEEGGSRSPEVRGMELIDVAVRASVMAQGFEGKKVVGREERRGIAIADLLS